MTDHTGDSQLEHRRALALASRWAVSRRTSSSACSLPPTRPDTTAANTTVAARNPLRPSLFRRRRPEQAPAQPSSPPGPIVATPALIARGRSLYGADGCSACHSLSGKAGVGPSLNAIVGRKVTLTSGETITSDDAYLAESIVSPDKKIVKGYGAGIMSAAIAGQDLAGNPDDVRALVAFVKSQK